jgi:3-oxoacyl-[acyl-carrier protein] reductase
LIKGEIMDLGLENKVALVTAASRGLGKSAAMALASEGAAVAICSRTDTIYQVAQEIRQSAGSDVHPVQADLTHPEDITRLIDETLERFGKIDILIINAGGPPPGSFLSLSPQEWEAAINLTLMSAVRLCYSVLPHMVERGSGSIVSSQSYSVKQPVENLMLSNSIRMAVIGLMKSLANELGQYGIRVNTINPGWTKTERVEELLDDRAKREGTTIEGEAQKITSSIPFGRMGTVEEFGRTIAWLASPAASYIHGHALIFDGGLTKAPL